MEDGDHHGDNRHNQQLEPGDVKPKQAPDEAYWPRELAAIQQTRRAKLPNNPTTPLLGKSGENATPTSTCHVRSSQNYGPMFGVVDTEEGVARKL